MFRLVGTETFKIGKRFAEITIASNGMSFEYVLSIDGKSLKKFIEVQAKNTRVWLPRFGENSEHHRVVLGESGLICYGMCLSNIVQILRLWMCTWMERKSRLW